MNLLDFAKLPYRKNVCCITFKQNKFLLVQNYGWPKNWWKFPQGGINDGETLEIAAIRELQEELGSNKFKILGISKQTNQYDWNDESLKLATYKWRGQIQNYVLVEFFGEDNDLKLNPEEMQGYKWVTFDNLWINIDHQDKNFTNYKNTIKKVLKEVSITTKLINY